ncbi:ribosome biogenesis GTPase Der [Zavarzinia compransoris]|uniref:ribosome biogenesis GTPase Der n=1 Tax=Zavarzinia marina TaxID=2911065 RepID=UPI001EEEE34F|nr:ribosome biogenesis GTPase Der [Zavarzinia marina]MCF4164954.1 ribosome biogenesis GTPase Der [Zavarzinia marina]
MVSEQPRLRIAIVGRPNVGKSTLFNRLVGKKLALVDDTPGVTRDRREGEGRLGELHFTVFDTAGFEDVIDDSMEGRMRRQTERAVQDADVVLFLFDARAGVTPLDLAFARVLRKIDRPLVLCANKAEGKEGQIGAAGAWELGLGDCIHLSAEHGEGMIDLFDSIVEQLEARGIDPFPDDDGAGEDEAEEAFDPDADVPEDPGKPLRIAVVGRPNVGKSSLINRLLGEDRLITGPEAGLTRDSISVVWDWQGREVKLFDTAGLRKKARVESKLEKLSAGDTIRAVKFAEVVILLIDAVQGIDRQDLVIADRAIYEGRALIVGFNKWDAVEDHNAALVALKEKLDIHLPQVRGLPVVTLSARTGRGLDKLMPAALDAYRKWNRRVPTAKLNRWLATAIERHPAPAVSGRRLRPRYMTQVKARPPTFALFMNRPGELPESYVRYLMNGLRETFDMEGTPVRINLRKNENPYTDD